ncbi:MAG: phage tail tape measure protein [Qingshengfaniella sp.]
MADIDGMDEFGRQVAALEKGLAGANSMAGEFSGELTRIRSGMADTNRQVALVSNGIGRGLRGAFDGLMFDGTKLSEVLGRVGQSMLSTAYSSAINPVTQHLGKLAGSGIEAAVGALMPFAKGGTFSGGRVMPFARGGVVSSPTAFPMQGGTGLMGEAGPEAIMPLSRGADGKLGVKAEGGARPVQVVMNISTPDVAGFRRSQSQVAQQMGRAINRGQRNR